MSARRRILEARIMADKWGDPMHGASLDALGGRETELENENRKLRDRIDELLTHREQYLARIGTLEASLRECSDLLRTQDNGHHVCRWCGKHWSSTGHDRCCWWVANRDEIDAAKGRARAALEKRGGGE